MLNAQSNGGSFKTICLFSVQEMTSNPTLLHFSARYNLVKLAVTILECPGGFDALNMANEDGLVPSQIAIECGNDRLGSVLVRILLHSLVNLFYH